MRLDTLVNYLDDYLRIAEEVADAPEAMNGLQVANAGEVGRSDATDFAGVCDLQPVHRLWRIGDFFGYAQIVVEIVDERVESHSRHRNYSIAPASGSFHPAGEAKMLKYNELDNPHYENAAVWISPLR